MRIPTYLLPFVPGSVCKGFYDDFSVSARNKKISMRDRAGVVGTGMLFEIAGIMASYGLYTYIKREISEVNTRNIIGLVVYGVLAVAGRAWSVIGRNRRESLESRIRTEGELGEIFR